MIKVFHARDDLDDQISMGLLSRNAMIRDAAMKQAWPDGYTEVARIDFDDLDEAWVWTQNRNEHCWTRTRPIPTVISVGIHPTHPDTPCRSTMIGDIFDFNGVLYIADRATGFSKTDLANG
jgi:hypothetical protein